MKNFVYVFLAMATLVIGLIISSPSLENILESELSSEAISSYAPSDLGFVVEEASGKEGHFNYVSGGKVVGECVYLKGNVSVNAICDKLGVSITNKYYVSGKLILEGVSPRIKYSASGKQANVQIAVSDAQVVVGVPIIYGSY